MLLQKRRLLFIWQPKPTFLSIYSQKSVHFSTLLWKLTRLWKISPCTTFQKTAPYLIAVTTHYSLEEMQRKSCLENWWTSFPASVCGVLPNRVEVTFIESMCPINGQLSDFLERAVLFNQQFKKIEKVPNVAEKILIMKQFMKHTHSSLKKTNFITWRLIGCWNASLSLKRKEQTDCSRSFFAINMNLLISKWFWILQTMKLLMAQF